MYFIEAGFLKRIVKANLFFSNDISMQRFNVRKDIALGNPTNSGF